MHPEKNHKDGPPNGSRLTVQAAEWNGAPVPHLLNGEPARKNGGRIAWSSPAENVSERQPSILEPPGIGAALERLRRTKTVEWMLGYIAMASLLLQLIDVLCHLWGWPIAFERVTSLLLGLGALPALVITWYHGEQGCQQVSRSELTLLVSIVTGSTFVVWSLCFAR